MKKFFALVLCMLMLLTCFVGCAEETEAPATEATEAPATEATETPATEAIEDADEVTQVTDETAETEALPYAGQDLTSGPAMWKVLPLGKLPIPTSRSSRK